MSYTSRKEYFEIITNEYPDQPPPTIVSHGAVNGLSWNKQSAYKSSTIFYESDINFFDEEIVLIGQSCGLFAIQFDTRRIAKKNLVRKNLKSLFSDSDVGKSVDLIWNQIRHIAEVLDYNNIFSWGTACIGSDYDGTIDPLPGIWTAEYFSKLYDGILLKASQYLKTKNSLKLTENKSISAQELTDRFFLENSVHFVKKFFH